MTAVTVHGAGHVPVSYLGGDALARGHCDPSATNPAIAAGTVPLSMSDYSSFDGHQVKHLEMIQAVISRLGTDSFVVKGWAVTVSGAFLGFAINNDEWGLALAGALPAVLFWGLDGYYLRTERLFRVLHDAVRTGSPPVEPFFMSATKKSFARSATNTSWSNVLFSATLGLFYGTLVVSAAVVALILCQ